MTFLTDQQFEFSAASQTAQQLPEPRSPEEVLSMLAQDPPNEEYSVDAF